MIQILSIASMHATPVHQWNASFHKTATYKSFTLYSCPYKKGHIPRSFITPSTLAKKTDSSVTFEKLIIGMDLKLTIVIQLLAQAI